jgi:hypothetical protein
MDMDIEITINGEVYRTIVIIGDNAEVNSLFLLLF